MQEGLGIRGDVKIIALEDELHIGQRQRRSGKVNARRRQILRRIDVIRPEERGQAHHEEGRTNPGDASLVELRQAERALRRLSQDHTGNQVPGDDEEHVHAHKPAGQPAALQVEDKHRQNRDGPQPIDGRTVWGRGRVHGVVPPRRGDTLCDTPPVRRRAGRRPEACDRRGPWSPLDLIGQSMRSRRRATPRRAKKPGADGAAMRANGRPVQADLRSVKRQKYRPAAAEARANSRRSPPWQPVVVAAVRRKAGRRGWCNQWRGRHDRLSLGEPGAAGRLAIAGQRLRLLLGPGG